jgi:hypothetical protein
MGIFESANKKGLIILSTLLMGVTLARCGGKDGSGTRDSQPDFGARSSIFSPGRGNVEFLENCFNLPAGEIADFVGWMAAAVKLDNLAKVCKGLSAAGFSEGVSTTKEPADID